MICRRGGRRRAWGLGVLLLALGMGTEPALAGAPPLTAAQQERLKERERHFAEALKARDAGKLAETIAAVEKTLAIEREVFGNVHEDVADTLEWLGPLRAAREDYAGALKAAREALAIRTKLHGEKYWRTTDARLRVAEFELLARLKPEERRRLLEAGALLRRASRLEQQGKAEEALPLTRKALDLRRRLLGDDHPHTAEALNTLGSQLQDRGDWKGARAAYEQGWAICKKTFGPEHPNTAAALNNLGSLLRAQGDYAGARRYFEQALATWKKTLGPEHPSTATALNNLGGLLQEQGDNAAARSCYEHALAIKMKVFGPGHPATATTLNSLAVVLQAQGDYAAARQSYEQALAVYKKALGPEHPNTAKVLNNLGSLLEKQGDYAAARRSFEQALAINKKSLGPDHPTTATTLSNLGLLLRTQGDYKAARPLLERALAVTKVALGPNHPHTAASLNNLGGLLNTQGDYAAARAYFEQALAIARKTYGPDHRHSATALNNLGGVLRSQEDIPAARSCLEQALAITQKALGPNHPDTANALNNLGVLLQGQRDYAGAERHFKQALAIGRKALGPDHPATVTALNNLGSLLQDQRDYAAARSYFEEALALLKKSLGAEHPDTAQALSNLASLLAMQGDYAGARKCLDQAFRGNLAAARLVLGNVAEAEALAYLDAAQLGRDPLLSVLRRLPDATPEQAYQAVWDSRALATRALAVRRLPPDADPKARDLWEQLRDKRARLAKLTLAVVPPAKARTRQQQLARLSDEKEELERRLAQASSAFRRQQELQRVGFAELAARLPANVALLDVVQTTFFESPSTASGKWKGAGHYEAFVLRPSAKAPGYSLAWVHLGESEPIDRAIDAWRQALLRTAASSRPDQAPERTLRRSLWDKVEEHLSGCTAVVIVPDGGLTRLPWAALPGRRPGSYLLEDYALSTVAYGRQLYDLLTRRPTTGDRALAVGGVRYDSAPRASGEALAAAHRGPAQEAGKRPRWGYLEGSRREAEAIAALWQKSGRVELLEGGDASEAALRQRLPGARYVHLATHGFFADEKFRSAFRHDVTHERLQLWDQPLLGKRATVTGRNPLLLSGVVLAGANLPQKTNEWGAPVGDDGILTGEEVAELDLHDTELVVLSACETGLGKAENNEGVHGLQRAFGLAGARSTIASLWKVDDAATQRLMTLFYENLWHKKLGKAEALRQAQLALLRDPTGQGGSRGFEASAEEGRGGVRTDPRLWAAWTLSGDPGGLSAVQPVRLKEQSGVATSEPAPPRWPVRPWLLALAGALLGVGIALAARSARRRARRA